MTNIAFFNHTLCYRGTSKAIYNYMLALNTSFSDIKLFYIFLKNDSGNRLGFALHLLQLGVELIPISSYEDLKTIGYSFDFLYHVTSAEPSQLTWLKHSRCRSTFIHQVGYQPPDYSSSDHFAYTSYWQSFYFTNGSAPVLPYIVNPPSRDSIPSALSARERFGIPNDALVLGRHGGADTWNLPFASAVVNKAVSERPDLWFIFVGTPRFTSHERVLFLNSITSMQELEYFFSASDSMIHSRWEGETFGMACAEFLIRGKPIITWSESREQNHLFLAGRSAITYNNPSDLYRLFLDLDKKYISHKSSLINTDLLSKYSSNVVVENFRRYF